MSDSIDDLERDAKEALQQIYDRKYAEELRTEGYRRIDCYGVSFSGRTVRSDLGKGKINPICSTAL